jgi:transcriptional regulator with XRE-family HTH domain
MSDESAARAGRDAVASDGFTVELGRQLARSRREHGWSQRDLAARSGVDQADISRIERGVLSPTTATVGKLVSALGLTVRIDSRPAVQAPPGSRYEDQRPYVVADHLADLRGPTKGTVRLGGRLDWSGRADYDLGSRRQLASVYETVLREASRPDELANVLDGPTLVSLWPDLVLPARLRRLWEARFPELTAQRRRVA